MKEKTRFDELSGEIFDGFLKFDPSLGTYFGVHEYDPLMPNGSRTALKNWINQLKSYEKRLKDFDVSKLDQKSLDLRLARDLIDLELFDIEEWKIKSKFPEGPKKIGESLFLLLVRNYPPAEERMKSISERIERSTHFLNNTKERLDDPIRIYCKIANQSARQLPSFLDGILKEAARHLQIEELNLLEERCKNLKEDLEDYRSWLTDKTRDAKEEFAIGRGMLKKRLELRGVEMDIESILNLGHDYLEKEKKKLSQLAKKINEKKSVDEVRRTLKEEHPDNFEEALKKYRKEILRARKFTKNQNFASVPENEKLKVIETPPFLRHVVPFAAYFRPAKFDERQEGIYIVTPPQQEGMMKEHNYYSISNTSVHEGYPGHHLQLSVANQHPSNLRLLMKGTEFVEGWAHYCEKAVKELGHDDTPKHRFIQTLDLVWRAARIIVDIGLSTGEMTFDEAVDFLIEHTGMEKEGAQAEVRRYSYTPGQPLSYLLGKHLIEELREEVESKLGNNFELQRFHDFMLRNGSIPIKYQREILRDKIIPDANNM